MQRALWVEIVLSVALSSACASDDTISLVPNDGPARADASVDAGLDRVSQVDRSASPDAAADSSLAPDGPVVRTDAMEPVDPTVPLAAQSPSCLACAEDNCANLVQSCAGIDGEATQGPAVGVSRAALCVETLSCVLSTGCAACDEDAGCPALSRFGDCYCRFDHPSVAVVPELCDPVTGQYAGPCKNTVLRALETTSTTGVLIGAGDVSKGGGWAEQLLQCLRDNRCTSCFSPPHDAGADAASDAKRDVASDARPAATADGAADATMDTMAPPPIDARSNETGDATSEQLSDAVSESISQSDATGEDSPSSSDGAGGDAAADETGADGSD